MTQFVKKGNSYDIYGDDTLQVTNLLPAKNYVVQQHPERGIILVDADEFTMPSKIYGSATRHADRIINTFEKRPSTTGVLLCGEKGSGKTLLTKKVAQLAVARGYPVLIVNSPLCGPSFNKFIQQIGQQAVVLFDEFEKVYDRDEQEQILTLLDGVFPSRTLFMLTVNDKWRVDSHMRNRPGRLFYMIDFKGLDEAFIREYCNDQLDQKQHIDEVCRLSKLFKEFNFDMLKALVEDMNRYQESPRQVLELLNARPEDSEEIEYTVTLKQNNGDVLEGDEDDCPEGQQVYRWCGNVMSFEHMRFNYKKPYVDEDGNKDFTWEQAVFAPTDIKKFDADSGEFVLVNKNGTQAMLKRKQVHKFDYFGAF